MIAADAPKKTRGGQFKTQAELVAAGSTQLDKFGKRRVSDGSTKRPKTWDRKPVPASALISPAKAIMLIPGYDPWKDSEGYVFDTRSAKRAVEWIHRHVTHVKGRLGGKGYRLTPLEQGIICNLFGWKSEKTGMRRYRKALIYVARKWGKTLFAAAIALYLLFECRESGEEWEYTEEGVEAYCAAAAKDQAKLLWGAAKRIIQNDEILSERCRIYQASVARIGPEGDQDSSFFQSICAEANTAHGFNPQVWVMDEVHAQKDGELMDVLDTGTASRTEPLAVLITTADFDRESICNEEHDYAKKVRDGDLSDPAYLPVICEVSLEDDWRDPETWKIANPKYPETPTQEYMEARCRKAQHNARFLNTFRRLNLNIKTQSDVQWFDLNQWDTMGDEFEWTDLIGRPCYAGLDMSSVCDLTAFVLVFPEDGNAILPFFWVPRVTVDRREEKQTMPSYRVWEDQGFMEVCSGGRVDQDDVLDKVRWAAEQFELRQVAMDRWNSAKAQAELAKDGIDVIEFGQGFASMSAPSKELEGLYVEGKMRHGGHPVLRWCAGNVMAETDNSPAENIKPVKAKTRNKQRVQDDNKIDGIVALVMGIGLAMVKEEPTTSVYEERGLVAL